MNNRIILGLRVVCLCSCLLLPLSGHYPPAHAQETAQDERFREIERRQQETDDKVQRQWMSMNDTHTDVTEMKGMVKGFGALFTLMLSGSIVFQVKNQKKG